jgi:hypothetical protein
MYIAYEKRSEVINNSLLLTSFVDLLVSILQKIKFHVFEAWQLIQVANQTCIYA